MRVHGAVIREQGQTFAVVVVKPHVIQNQSEAANVEGRLLKASCKVKARYFGARSKPGLS